MINKSIKDDAAFVVIMATSGGLFGDAVMLFDWSTSDLPQPASSTIDEMAEDLAQRMLEMLGDRPCICDKCGQPTNLN